MAQGNHAPLLQVDSVTVRFGGLAAVSDASFAVDRGEIKGLIGPNGAGKTTLFNVVSGVVRPTAGRIVLNGTDLTAVPVHRRAAAGIARTFQTVQIFDGLTVAENVQVGCHSSTSAGLWAGTLRLPGVRKEETAIAERARTELEFVGLGALAERPAAQLPFGQQRMLEIARALAAGPQLLLLDEPASGLNSVEVELLASRMQAIRARGITLLLVEHNVDLVMRICDSMVVLERGAVIADSTPAAVRSDPRVQAAYLGEGASGYAAG